MLCLFVMYVCMYLSIYVCMYVSICLMCVSEVPPEAVPATQRPIHMWRASPAFLPPVTQWPICLQRTPTLPCFCPATASIPMPRCEPHQHCQRPRHALIHGGLGQYYVLLGD